MLAKKFAWFPTWQKLYEHTKQEFISLIMINMIKEAVLMSYNQKIWDLFTKFGKKSS